MENTSTDFRKVYYWKSEFDYSHKKRVRGYGLIQMTNIIKKLFYSVVQTSSEMLSFLHRQDYCWKFEFNTDFKIE